MEKLAQYYGKSGYKATPFSQYDYMTDIKDVGPSGAFMTAHVKQGNSGVCRALVCEYLIHNLGKAGLEGVDTEELHFFSRFTSRPDTEDVKTLVRAARVAGAQTAGAFQGPVDEAEKLRSIGLTLASLSNGKVKVKSQELEQVALLKLGTRTWTAPSFSYISSGAHATAAVARDYQDKGPKYKFFDPNQGQVTMSDVNEFRGFVMGYFYTINPAKKSPFLICEVHGA